IMPNCCVTGCHNRYYPGSTIRFYRVPSGNRQFQVQRRRLWIEAIQQANGSSEIRADARICGVHFISGEASTDPDRPNFVPTLFTCSKLRQGPTRKAKWTSSACRRSQRQKSNVETKTITTRRDDEEEETEDEKIHDKDQELTECEAEPETMETENKSSPSPSPQKLPGSVLKPDKMNPVVLIKPLVLPQGAYHVDLCDRTFTTSHYLKRHKLLHVRD
uniref:THAP-type domain-containing protein n=1 Tax=Poecilia formosa TaxID=48698 RepID=A0A096LVX1_POEFO